MLILATAIGAYFREMLYMVDFMIYTFVGGIYNLFIDITKVRVDNDTINGFANSIYAIIAVYSLFIMSKMLINTIINPDGFSDKKKGVGSIFTRLVTAIFLIVLLPLIFKGAYWVQDKAINADSKNPGIILELLLGERQQLVNDVDPGEEIKNLVIQALIRPDEGFVEPEPLYIDIPKLDGNGKFVRTIRLYNYKPKEFCISDNDCSNAIIKYNEYLTGVALGVKNMMITLKPVLTTRVKDANDNKEFVLSYTYIVVTLCGLFIGYILISFSIDVAVRVFKLGVLEILAPLFVASYVDAKSAESGPFSKWLKETTSTYIQVFIRVALMGFLIVFIRLMQDSSGTFFGLTENGTSDRWLVKLALVLGLLLFIKKAPKMIEDLLGIKSDSKLGIMEKLGGAAIIGGAAKSMGEKIKKTRQGVQRAAYGGVKRGIGSGISGYSSANKVPGATTKQKFRQSLGGFAKGLRTGAVEGYSAENTKGYYTKGRKATDTKYKTLGEKVSDLAKKPLLNAEKEFWDQDLEKKLKKQQRRERLLMPPGTDPDIESDFIAGKQIGIPRPGEDPLGPTSVPYPIRDTAGRIIDTKREPVLRTQDLREVKQSAEFKVASPEAQYATVTKMLGILENTATASVSAVDSNKEIRVKLSEVLKQLNDEKAKKGPDLTYIAQLENEGRSYEGGITRAAEDNFRFKTELGTTLHELEEAKKAVEKETDETKKSEHTKRIAMLETRKSELESKVSHNEEVARDLDTKLTHAREKLREESAKVSQNDQLVEQLEQVVTELQNEQERNTAAIEKAKAMQLKVEGEPFDPENYEHRAKVIQYFAKEKEDAEKLKPADKK